MRGDDPSEESLKCQRATVAALAAIEGMSLERQTRARWIINRCRRCGGCVLAG